MNYLFGKRIAFLGFGVVCICNFLYVLMNLLPAFFGFSDIPVNEIINYVSILAYGVTAFGFLIMWVNKKDFIDFITAGAIGLSVAISILWLVVSINTLTIVGMLISIASSAYYLVFAFRAKGINIPLSLALLCAFVYNAFSGVFFINFLYLKLGLQVSWVFLIWNIGFLVCSGLCLIERKVED